MLYFSRNPRQPKLATNSAAAPYPRWFIALLYFFIYFAPNYLLFSPIQITDQFRADPDLKNADQRRPVSGTDFANTATPCGVLNISSVGNVRLLRP